VFHSCLLEIHFFGAVAVAVGVGEGQALLAVGALPLLLQAVAVEDPLVARRR